MGWVKVCAPIKLQAVMLSHLFLYVKYLEKLKIDVNAFFLLNEKLWLAVMLSMNTYALAKCNAYKFNSIQLLLQQIWSYGNKTLSERCEKKISL